MNFGPYLVPEEYWWFSKLIFFILMGVICVFSFVGTLSKNKKRLKKYEEKHKNNNEAESEKKRKLTKSATVKLVKNIFLFHALYGILFVDIWQGLLVGAVFLICVIVCSIHWKSTKCLDFPDFFAVKSGWLTSLVLLVIGEFLVGSLYGNILPRVMIMVTSIGALWLISLIHTLLRFKKYYGKKKTFVEEKTEDNKNSDKEKEPKNKKKAKNKKKSKNEKNNDDKVREDNEETLDNEEKFNDQKTHSNDLTPPVIDRTGEHTIIQPTDDKSPTIKGDNKTSINNPVSITVFDGIDKTLKPQIPLNMSLSSNDTEEQIRNQLISKFCRYVEFYHNKKANEELIGDESEIEVLTTFDPLDYQNINLDINIKDVDEEDDDFEYFDDFDDEKSETATETEVNLDDEENNDEIVQDETPSTEKTFEKSTNTTLILNDESKNSESSLKNEDKETDDSNEE